MNLISLSKLLYGLGLFAMASCFWLCLNSTSNTFGQKAYAQQNVGITTRDLMLDMHNVAKTAKAFYKKHKHLPMQPREQDELLHILYKQSTEYNPDLPLPMPSSQGPYRTIGRFRIEYNLSINQNSNTLILWRRTPPPTWYGPEGSIGIVSNGDERLLLYAIGGGGSPIRSEKWSYHFSLPIISRKELLTSVSSNSEFNCNTVFSIRKFKRMNEKVEKTKSKGIKRHPCLKPLSRDHLVALMGAQRLMKAGNGEIEFHVGIEFFLNVWNNEICQHLKDEEEILPQFIKDKTDLERLLSDHKALREYSKKISNLNLDNPDDKEKQLAKEAGEFLDKHIRWEEREFFPRIETTNSAQEIKQLLALTDKVESSRQRGKSCEPRKNTKKRNKPKA